MDIRKDDTERAINLLKFYKSKLNRPDDKSLKKSLDKLIETLEAPLFSALLDIQEFYEVSLSTAIDGNQPRQYDKIDAVREEVQESAPKSKKEKSKKSKRRSKGEDDEPEVVPQLNAKVNLSQQYSPEPQSPKRSQDYQDSRQNYQQEEYEDEEIVDDENNPWLYFQIDLVKGNRGYGFGVAGGYDKQHYEGDNGIFVSKIIPDGVAEKDGRLRIDDVIVTVNDVNLEYVDNEFAVNTLKNAGPKMTMIIRRLKDDYLEAGHQDNEESNPNQSHSNYYPEHPDNYEEEVVENQDYIHFEVTLTKRPTGGLGISILGGYDENNPEQDAYISISKLTPNGVADADGRLQVGDIILHVDDQSLTGMTHEDVVELLKNTGRQVTLYIGRYVGNEDQYQEPEEPVVEKTEKKKKKKHRRDREREE